MKLHPIMKRCLALLLFCALLLPAALPAAKAVEKNSGVVRVLLTRLNLTDRVDIALDGSYTLNEISFQRGSHLTVAASENALYVYYEGMALEAGTSLTLRRHAVEEGEENGLRFNGAYELHPGDLHLSLQNGQLRPVLEIPVEEYLLGVVPYEMSDSYPLDALKAQAVAARTYALRKARANAKNAYDLVDNTNDQVYYGTKKENDRAARAILETAGICGYYKNTLAECYYSASNGGQTELPIHVWGENLSYYIMAEDPYDLENMESPVKKASLPKTFENADALGKLRDAVLGRLTEAVESLGYDGDPAFIQVTGIRSAVLDQPMFADSPSKIMTRLCLELDVQARRLLEDDEEEDISIFAEPDGTAAPASENTRKGLKKSSWSAVLPLPEPVTIALDVFPTVESALDLSINGSRNEIITVREEENAFILESRRYGHGVGMSQRGAQCMAEKYHWNYDQILRFYYPGVMLNTVRYTYVLPAALSQRFLATPGPAATPTPRPTLMPVSATPGPGEFKVLVNKIGVNSYLNLRAEPNTQSTVLRQLYYGQELMVTQELEGWFRVQTDDAEGYVMRDYVSAPGQN